MDKRTITITIEIGHIPYKTTEVTRTFTGSKQSKVLEAVKNFGDRSFTVDDLCHKMISYQDPKGRSRLRHILYRMVKNGKLEQVGYGPSGKGGSGPAIYRRA